jgi:hypothetical protein
MRSTARASPFSSPRTSSSGRCRNSSPGTRAANTSPTGSASRRRATKPSVNAEVWSSHCASSTTHNRGRSSAASDNKLSTARPTRNRSGAGPAVRPKTVRSASRCGPGNRSRRSSSGTHNWCRPANASSISDSTPTARSTVRSDAAATRCSSSAVLPIPASPRRTKDRLRPRRMSASKPSNRPRSSARPSRRCPVSVDTGTVIPAAPSWRGAVAVAYGRDYSRLAERSVIKIS